MSFTQTGLQLIKNEIVSDPATRGYAGKSDLNIAKLMNEPLSQLPKVYQRVDVVVQDVVKTLIRLLEWKKVVDTSILTTAIGIRAFYFVELCKLHTLSISAQDSDIQTLVNSLVSDGTLTATARDALIDLTREEVLKSRSMIVVGSPVAESDVTEAKKLP